MGLFSIQIKKYDKIKIKRKTWGVGMKNTERYLESFGMYWEKKNDKVDFVECIYPSMKNVRKNPKTANEVISNGIFERTALEEMFNNKGALKIKDAELFLSSSDHSGALTEKIDIEILKLFSIFLMSNRNFSKIEALGVIMETKKKEVKEDIEGKYAEFKETIFPGYALKAVFAREEAEKIVGKEMEKIDNRIRVLIGVINIYPRIREGLLAAIYEDFEEERKERNGKYIEKKFFAV